MKIAIIGAGAGIGLVALNQAFKKGHEVVVLSTNIENIAPFILNEQFCAEALLIFRSANGDKWYWRSAGHSRHEK